MARLLFSFMAVSAWILATEQHCSNIKYYDSMYDNSLDSYYDRAVAVVHINKHYLAPGIFIEYHIILTSYNPFRNIKRYKYRLNQTVRVCVFRDRTTEWKYVNNKKVKVHVFKATTHVPTCGRQIVPIPEAKISTTQWHGTNKRNSPLHDLVLIRIRPSEVTKRSGRWSPFLYFPVVAHVAEPHEKLGREVMFASFAFLNVNHSKSFDTLLSRKYKFDEDVVVDCDFLLPRTWGYFICLRNIDRYVGVGSGALLVYKDSLFGIGSFLLQKGNRSYLVFTDLRPYHHMLGAPCNQFEMYFWLPESYLHSYYVRNDWNRVYYLHPEADYDIQLPPAGKPTGDDRKETGRRRSVNRRHVKSYIDL